MNFHSFYAHEHSDTIRVFRDLKGSPIGTAFVCPSLTTFSGYNPSARLYQYDHSSKVVVNYYQYFSNLTTDNANGKITFQPAYNPLSGDKMQLE